MLQIRQAIIVEGKYDKIKLSSIVKAVIIPTHGFRIFKDEEMLALIRHYAETTGIIILTDSDRAGFRIRSYLKGAISGGSIKNIYIPDIFGKEKRKEKPSAEGKLGVEGMSRDVIIESLRRAGATFIGEENAAEKAEITKADLMDLGLYGPGSNERRKLLIKKLGFPEKISTNAFLQAVNLLYTLDELTTIMNSLEKDNG